MSDNEFFFTQQAVIDRIRLKLRGYYGKGGDRELIDALGETIEVLDYICAQWNDPHFYPKVSQIVRVLLQAIDEYLKLTPKEHSHRLSHRSEGDMSAPAIEVGE